MIILTRESINHCLELNDNIEFNEVEVDGGFVVYSSEVFKNFDSFLELYELFPVLPSSQYESGNPFMVQSFPGIVAEAFINLTLKHTEIIEKYSCSKMSSIRGNVTQNNKIVCHKSSILPHIDNAYLNKSLVCNFWVNVSDGDGTQLWKFDDSPVENYEFSKYKESCLNDKTMINFYNYEGNDRFTKNYFISAKNNTCCFYYSNLLHTAVINNDNTLRCSIVSWYELEEKQ